MAQTFPVFVGSKLREMTEEQAERFAWRKMPLDQKVEMLHERLTAQEAIIDAVRRIAPNVLRQAVRETDAAEAEQQVVDRPRG